MVDKTTVLVVALLVVLLATGCVAAGVSGQQGAQTQKHLQMGWDENVYASGLVTISRVYIPEDDVVCYVLSGEGISCVHRLNV